MMDGIWILGATGRVGRAVASKLAARGLQPVLVGRNGTALGQLAAQIGGNSVIEAATVETIIAKLDGVRPSVVINTIGPFAETAVRFARACPAGTHYVDLCNELAGTEALLSLNDEAVNTGRTLVTGAGFGVLGTESVVLKLCEGQPNPERVRADAIPSIDSEPGPLGQALAASLIGVLAEGGRRFENGHLVRSHIFDDFAAIPLPDGNWVKTAGGANGELLAARRASKAPFVVAANSLAPSSAILRRTAQTLLVLLKSERIRSFAIRRIAAINVRPTSDSRERVSWAHASAIWPSGAYSEGWLKIGDAMEFTSTVLAEVVVRLHAGGARLGAYTPGALFGPELAEDCGGRFYFKGASPV